MTKKLPATGPIPTVDAVALTTGKTLESLGHVLGVSKQAVQQWGATIPQLRCYQLRERRPDWFLKTKGKR